MQQDTLQKAALWFLGGWIFLSISMAYVAGGTFATLKPDVLHNANDVFREIEAGEKRTGTLRYVASELNRKFFPMYGNVQLVVGVLAFLLVGASKRRAAALLILIALALAAWFRFDLIPEATELGRQIDFEPREPVSEKRAVFDALHKRSTSVEGAKMLVLLAASFLAARRPRA